MPNWCMNSVEIVGDVETLEAIAEAAKEGKLLEYLAPIGEWDYGKAVETWGTKWDVTCEDPYLDPDSNTLTLNFDSAWGPPTEAYFTGVDRHNVSITGYYYESGMMFAGKYEDGYDNSYEVDFENENWKDDIPDDIIDHWDLESEYESWKEWQQEEENEDD